MSDHISKQFDQELERVRARVLHMGGTVEDQILRALQALTSGDLELARRVIADDLQNRHPGSAFIVENKPGAAGNIGTDAVAKAQPNGSTIGISLGGPLAINTLLFPKMPYDPDKDIAPIYALAYNLFRAGKFAEAAEYYKVLLLLDPFRPSFSMALGACYHRIKKYDFAAILYMQASLFDNTDPLPFFYTYDCFMHLNDSESAILMLPNVIERAGESDKYKAIKQKAQLLLDEYLKAGGRRAQGSA